LLADAGQPFADALSAADDFSWHVDPWLGLEVAWRELPPPFTDEVLLARGDYGAVRGFTLPRRDHRWSMAAAWVRMRPATAAPAYVVALDMGFPEPSTLEGGEVVVRVRDGATARFRVGRDVGRHTFETPAPASGVLLVKIEAPTWNRLDHPAEQGVRVDRVGVQPVRDARSGMVRSPRP
jgi:hypothetical protein